MEHELKTGNFIVVVPCLQQTRIIPISSIETSQLFFWYENSFRHPIDDRILRFFLTHVQLFGATIFPNRPELGCIAINRHYNLLEGEIQVSQIHFKGEMIYYIN